jgi:hypothetical protein
MNSETGFRWLQFCALLVVASLMSACENNSSSNTSTSGTTGPDAILNGSSLSSATSHWVGASCKVQVELTSDKGFWSIVVDTSGTTSSGGEMWAVGPNANSVTVGPGSGQSGFFWVSALTNISGSTSSQTFTAGVTVDNSTSTTQNLGTCTFTLQQGSLP